MLDPIFGAGVGIAILIAGGLAVFLFVFWIQKFRVNFCEKFLAQKL